MSRSGTVKCSFCKGTGHNIRGCEYLKKQAASDKDKGLNTYYTEKVDGFKNSRRSCSWCGEPGHNSRTCKSKVIVEDWFVKVNQEWKSRFVRNLRERGIGLGAIVSQEQQLYNTQENFWEWVDITFHLMGIDSKECNIISSLVDSGTGPIMGRYFAPDSKYRTSRLKGATHLSREVIAGVQRRDHYSDRQKEDVMIKVLAPAPAQGVDYFENQIMSISDDSFLEKVYDYGVWDGASTKAEKMSVSLKHLSRIVRREEDLSYIDFTPIKEHLPGDQDTYWYIG